jgi:nucleoside 2-deoxyribosyltransferase
MKKKIYIAGPMTGLPDLNFQAFHGEAAWLRAMGKEVVNPAEINPAPTKKWEDCMRADIAQLVTCDGIHLLEGWEKSRGATLEHHIASSLGMAVTFSPRVAAGARRA